MLQLISGPFEHSLLHVREINALENAVFHIAVYGPYKFNIYTTRNVQNFNATVNVYYSGLP